MQDPENPIRRLRVFRYKRGDARGEHFELFDVPVRPRMTLLDALLWIKRHRDPSLAVRHSCLHASCGMCGVQADGRERLACVTDMSDLGAHPTIEPIANLPVLTDLVADVNEFHERFAASHPVLRTSDTPASEPPNGHATDVRFEDCIECGLCLSACPVVATAPGYVGPRSPAPSACATSRAAPTPPRYSPGRRAATACGPAMPRGRARRRAPPA